MLYRLKFGEVSLIKKVKIVLFGASLAIATFNNNSIGTYSIFTSSVRSETNAFQIGNLKMMPQMNQSLSALYVVAP